jgi:hypothetical protein
LTYTNAQDIRGDNSIFVLGGLYPDLYSITVAAVDLTSTVNITCADNTNYNINYSVELFITSNDGDVTIYNDFDDTCQSSITITRNDSYIEGSFSSILNQDFPNNENTI